MPKNTPSKKFLNSLCMSLERVVGTQIRFLFMAIWARFWVVHSGWRRRCVRWSGFLGLRGLGLSISVGLLSVRVNKSNMLLFQLITYSLWAQTYLCMPVHWESRLQTSAVICWTISRMMYDNSWFCKCSILLEFFVSKKQTKEPRLSQLFSNIFHNSSIWQYLSECIIKIASDF